MTKNTIVITYLLFCVNLLFASWDPSVDSRPTAIKLNGDEKFLKEVLDTKLECDSQGLAVVDSAIHYCKTNDLNNYLAQFYLIKAAQLMELDSISEGVYYCLQVLELYKSQKTSLDYTKEAYILLSEGFLELGAHQESINHRLRYLNLSDWDTWDPKLNNSLCFMGELYLRGTEHDSAFYYFEQSKMYSIKFGKERCVAQALNNLGLTIYKIAEFDSAAGFFEESLKIYRTKHTPKDSLQVGIITGNLAICYPLNKEKDKILRLIDKQIAITKRFKDYDALSIAYFEKCNTYYNLKEYSNTQLYLDSCLIANLKRKQNEEVRYQRLGIYGSYFIVARLLRDFDKSMVYHDLYFRLNDSIYGSQVKQELIQSITQYRLSGIKTDLKLKDALLNRSLNEIKVMEQEEQYYKMKIIFSILVGVLLVVIAGMIITKMRSENEKRMQIKELNEKMLKDSNQFKSERLTHTALSLTRKVEFSKELINRLSQIKGVQSSDLSSLKVYISNEFRTDESFLEMDGIIAELSKDFFVKLKSRFPNLSENEVKLCGFIKLGLSNKEISMIKNIEPNSVKVAKNRLRRKLGLTPETRILECLNQIG